MSSRRKPSRRKPRRRRPKTALAKASSALRQVRQMKSNMEKHHVDFAITFPDIDTTADELELTAVVQGDGNNQRVGLKLMTNNLNIRFIASGIVNALDSSLYRVMVVQDRRQEAGVTPTIGDVIESLNVNSQLNISNLGRFKVWHDHVYYLAELASGNGPTQRYTNINIALKVPVRYIGPLVTDIAKNGLYLMAITNDPDPGTLNINGIARLSFTDT